MSSVCRQLRRIWLTNPQATKAATTTPPLAAKPPSFTEDLPNEPNFDSRFEENCAASSYFGSKDEELMNNLRKRERLFLQSRKHAEATRKAKLDMMLDMLSASSSYFRNLLGKHRRFSAIEFEEILEIQKKFEEDDTKEGGAVRLISMCGIAGMLQHAEKLFEELPELECPRTAKSFNALLVAALHSKEYERLREIFRDYPPKFCVFPDVVSYNTVIRALGEMGLVDEANLMVDEMMDKGLEPNLITFNSILDLTYEKKGFSEGEKAWDLLRKKMRGLVPDISSYDAKLNAMVNEGMVFEAVNLFLSFEGRGLEPTVSTYNCLIKGLCSEGFLSEADECYWKLVQSDGLFPNCTTFETLIKAAFRDNGDSYLEIDSGRLIPHIIKMHMLLGKWGSPLSKKELLKNLLSKNKRKPPQWDTFGKMRTNKS